MAQAPWKWVSGGFQIPFTAAQDYKAGEVVLQGTMLGVIVEDIDYSLDPLGSIWVNGVFDAPKSNDNLSAIGTAVYWDADGTQYGGSASGALDTTATANTFAGWNLETAGTTTGTVRIWFQSRFAVSVTTADDLTDVGTVDYTAGDILIADGSKFECLPLSGPFNLSAAGLLSMDSATVAAAGADQTNAAAVADGYTLATGGNAAAGVKLPTAAAGGLCIIKNNAAAVLYVYPYTSDAIDALGADNAMSVQPYDQVEFHAYNAVLWTTDRSAVASLYGAQTVAGIKTFSSMPRIPINAGVTALGNAIGNAAAVAEGFTVVTGADANLAVKLPEAVAGAKVILKSVTAAVLKVFPAVNDAINAAAANAVFNMPASTCCEFTAIDGVTWYTGALIPA